MNLERINNVTNIMENGVARLRGDTSAEDKIKTLEIIRGLANQLATEWAQEIALEKFADVA